jgi:hypothetical protein
MRLCFCEDPQVAPFQSHPVAQPPPAATVGYPFVCASPVSIAVRGPLPATALGPALGLALGPGSSEIVGPIPGPVPGFVTGLGFDPVLGSGSSSILGNQCRPLERKQPRASIADCESPRVSKPDILSADTRSVSKEERTGKQTVPRPAAVDPEVP